MKCPECLGTSFEWGQFDIAQMFKQQPVMIKNVPAHRCIQCGYLIISKKVAQHIETVLMTHTSTAAVPAPVFDLAAISPKTLPEQ